MTLGMETNSSPETQPTPAPESQAAGTSAASSEGQSTASPQTPPAEGAPSNLGQEGAPAPFTPNFKFKVLDKEHEIDELVRGVIKDADSEKKIKELYEKAYGLDVVKPRFQQTRQELQEIRTQHQSLLKDVQEVREHYARGDFDSFFKTLQIPEEKVLQWMYDKITYNQLPPEQRQPLDARKAAEQRAWAAEQRAMELEQVASTSTVEAKRYALQVALERPDVKSFAQNFDTRAGKPGAFVDELYDIGEAEWARSQGRVDLTPEQAIQKVMSKYGAFLGGQAQQAPPPGVQGTQAPNPTAQTKVPVIPNVGGAATSPTQKPKARNLEDIKKLAAAFS